MKSAKTAEKGCTECGEPTYAKGLCGTHYQQARRHERGEGRPLGKVKKIAKPGEGDQVSFKLDSERKQRIAYLAETEGVDAADLYREAVDLLVLHRTSRSATVRACVRKTAETSTS